MFPISDSRRVVLVIHPGSMGDVILSLPALRAIRRRWPSQSLLLVAKGEIGSLLHRCHEVDHSFKFESGVWASLWSSGELVAPEVQTLLGRCDAVIAWFSQRQDAMKRVFSSAGVGDVRIGSPHDPELGSVHQTDRYGEAIGIDDVSAHEASCPLRLPASMAREGAQLIDQRRCNRSAGFVVLHPGSGSRDKCVSPARLKDLVTGLSERGRNPLIICGPADHEQAALIQRELDGSVPAVVDLPLSTAAGLLCCATAYIGHDSGLTHLAAALGVRTLAIFGPTDPARWAPRGRHVYILRGMDCRCGEWDKVRACRDKPCLAVDCAEVLACCEDIMDQPEESQRSAKRPPPSACSDERGCARLTS